MNDSCCICLEEFNNEVYFNQSNFDDIENIKKIYKKDNIKYQISCNCNGSIYHLECLEKLIYLNYIDCKCCYCRQSIIFTDKYKLNEYFRENDISIDNFVRKIILYLFYFNFIFIVINYIIYLNQYKTFFTFIQILNLFEFYINYDLYIKFINNIKSAFTLFIMSIIICIKICFLFDLNIIYFTLSILFLSIISYMIF